MKRKLTLVSVTWKDACCHHGTFTAEEIEKTEDMVCHTGGYLIKSGKKCIRVAQEMMDKKDGRCREVHTIRRVDVVKVIKQVIEVEE